MIRSHWRLTSPAVRATASPKTCGWRRTIFARDRGLDVGQVEDALLGAELGVQDDLEEQVAELLGEGRRRARLERVVDLVGLLEQVLAQRLVGLLAVPRAAVGLAQPARDPGHRPRAGDADLGRDRRQVQRAVEVGRGRASPTVVPSAIPKRPTGDPLDTAAEDAERVVAAAARARPGSGRGVRAASRPAAAARQEHRQRHDEDRPRRLDRRRDQALGGDDLEPAGGSRPQRTAPRRRARRARSGRYELPAGRSGVMSALACSAANQLVNALPLSVSS